MSFEPSYISQNNKGKLDKIIKQIEEKYESCSICPHQCYVNRFEGREGFCKTGHLPFVASFNAHYGEEPPLVGFNGSGTIFFSNCNLKCKFCQNYDISQLGHGKEISYEELAQIMIALQKRGCHNINFVSPTHQLLAILKALKIAIKEGLNIPLVYNSGGYDSAETLRLINGVFDLYMPDLKYFDEKNAFKYSGIKDYDKIVKIAITEMHSQVCDLIVNKNGIATRGLIIRHLVLPSNISNSKKVIDFVAKLSKNSYMNLMDQYRPEFKAYELPEINCKINIDEFNNLISYSKEKGLTRIG